MTPDKRAALARRQVDRHRRETLGHNAKLLLLKADGANQRFKALIELAEAWSKGDGGSDGQSTFRICRVDDEFNGTAKEASHVVVLDSANNALNNLLFEVDRGTTSPAGAGQLWRVTGKPSGKRYIPA